MALTPLPSSIGRGSNPWPSDREPSALPLDHSFRFLYQTFRRLFFSYSIKCLATNVNVNVKMNHEFKEQIRLYKHPNFCQFNLLYSAQVDLLIDPTYQSEQVWQMHIHSLREIQIIHTLNFFGWVMKNLNDYLNMYIVCNSWMVSFPFSSLLILYVAT
jgi:hypothetical protein